MRMSDNNNNNNNNGQASHNMSCDVMLELTEREHYLA